MRIPLIDPKDLTDEQKPLYDDMKAGIASNFNAFTAMREDGALMGPWNPWLTEPRIGKAIWDLTKVMSMEARLPPKAREIAILVTGAHFNSAYEIYAHVAVAEAKGISEQQLATLVAGVKPTGLQGEEEAAYDVAHALVTGSVLPRPTYDMAVRTFGKDGAAELIYLVGLYCMVSMTLNGFNVPVPEEEA
ncbi:carboxymuconolactone decarboxylase family protein [Fulvimarina sp. 2208YS6-2-32]|uniref:Carboxymuconolactone decarboxylase family protein n=1 Tax=Fulvimarina uroteuthidis TaxID=3098149 RepID=A0ABU5I6I4_9HYPH|nr:carboxymuconolactone decarboxylase family protein [Fulvimarina sp. 2208YS6-2-32]MDY8110998.1 carboxymuconolactone decarboxylase family protein [Fulvimarina sp. 2208YS6-2-32]